MTVGVPNFTFLTAAEQGRRQRLNDAGIRRFAPSGDRVYCEPIVRDLAATEIEFTTAGPLTGWYVRANNRLDLWFQATMQSPSVGASQWVMELPDGMLTESGSFDIGTWAAERPSTSAIVMGVIRPGFSGKAQFIYSNAGTKTAVGPTTPFTWQSADIFSGHITALVA